MRNRRKSMVLSIINNKGGTGKTTTAVSLAAALAANGYKTVLVDLDPQSSASISLGVRAGGEFSTAADVLFAGEDLADAPHPSGVKLLDIVPGDPELANTDLMLADNPDRAFVLDSALESVRRFFDFIICDCPPSLSLLSVNALVACDAYIVPMTAEYLALEGLVDLTGTLTRIEEGLGVRPELLGILFTMVNSMTHGTKEYRAAISVMKAVKERFGDAVFKHIIRRDVRLAEAPAEGKCIFEYSPKTRGARSYELFAQAVLERCSRKEG